MGGGKKMAAAFHALMTERLGVTTPGTGVAAAMDAAFAMTTNAAVGGAAAAAAAPAAGGDGTVAAGAAPAAAAAASAVAVTSA